MTVVTAEPGNFLPIDPGYREGRAPARAPTRLSRRAIIAAALLHAVVLAAILVQWPFIFTPPLAEKEPITVALVVEPPPAEPPPKAKPEPTPPEITERHSGPDQETTAPPQADTKGVAAAPKPQLPPEPEQGEVPIPARPKPSPPVTQTTPKIKEAERETAPEPVTRSAVHVAIGEALKEGDPYLNTLMAMLEQHRFYPSDAIGAFGKRLEGTAIYLVQVSPSGTIDALRLSSSSGSDSLDAAAATMIKQTAPFPRLPDYVHGNSMVLEWKVRVFPSGQ